MPRKEEYKRNPEKFRLYLREYNQKLRKTALNLLGNRCVKCGFDDTRAL